jgi:hypothetical protein
MFYSINQSVNEMLRNSTISTVLGTFSIVYFGYLFFPNLNLDKIYQNKIHKEIKQIVSNYSENVKKNNYKIDENTKKHTVAFKINNFKPNKDCQIDFSNKEISDAIKNLQNNFSNVSIKTSKYPYYNRVIIERDEINNINVSFDD